MRLGPSCSRSEHRARAVDEITLRGARLHSDLDRQVGGMLATERFKPQVARCHRSEWRTCRRSRSLLKCLHDKVPLGRALPL